VDPAEVEAYRRRHQRTRAILWWSVVLVALGVGYGIGLVWSLLVGAVVTIALIAAAQPLYLRWDRACWLKRFPELAHNPNIRWPRRWW
jgi:hypothetical protein